MKIAAVVVLGACVAFAGCGKKKKELPNYRPLTDAGFAPPVATGAGADAAAIQPAEKPPAPSEPAILTMVGFPNAAPDTQAGQYAFAPTDTSLKSAVEGADHEKGRLGYGVVQIVEPGERETKVEGMGAYVVPNALLVPIPKGVTVAVGDIVAASQYGNDFQHAIITDAAAPKANFMETMPYTAPHEAALKPDQFVKIDGSEWQAGSRVAYKTDKTVGWEIGTIVRASGEQLLVLTPVGDLRSAKKSEARMPPMKPALAKGADVFAIWDSVHFMKGKLEKVDDKLGVYHIRFEKPFDDQTKQAPFLSLLPEALE